MELKQQLIEIVRDFRDAFGLKQNDEALHAALIIEETAELMKARSKEDAVDAYADLVFVLSGAIIDGFDHFGDELEMIIQNSEEVGLDLLRATQTVFDSNMSKLCSRDEIRLTAEKYDAIGVDVSFEQIGDTRTYRCICSETVIGFDGKEYPIGKLLKSVGYREPDWSYLGEVTQFNDPCRLPPVGCKLVIKVGDTEMIATRTGYIADRNDAMEYKLETTGELISGRFWWSYP